MALIPVGAYDYKTALVSARISFLDGGVEGADADTATFVGDTRGFTSATVASGVITVTLNAEAIASVADILIVGCHMFLYDTGTDVLTRAQVKSIDTTTGAIVIWNVLDDGTSGVPALAALNSNQELHLTVLCRYSQG